MKTLFLTLRTFSATGGIEKVCRILGKALYEFSIANAGTLQVCSMYDRQQDARDNQYFPSEYFRGYRIDKTSFIANMLFRGRKSDVIIISHINLLPVGYLIKKLKPSVKLVLLAHGIEIWYAISSRKKRMLHSCDAILCVSHYTMEKIIEMHQVKREKCRVLNNCLDPFLALPSLKGKSSYLLEKYGFKPSDIIALSLTRISSKERYKGYDKVIEAIHRLPSWYAVKYLVAGAYDLVEKKYLDDLIRTLHLEDKIVLTGFIKDEELKDHFTTSDLYVMPSRKEGFGIVFIEAMYYGLPVIAGNTDGSVDALINGQLGQLIDPDDVESIADSIANIVENKTAYIPSKELLLRNFSYEAYKHNLEKILDGVTNKLFAGKTAA